MDFIQTTMKELNEFMDDQTGVQPTPPTMSKVTAIESSTSRPVANRFTRMEKHRPVWARGLTATELDRRQEQARVMNHGHQILLESKLGKLDLREKRSVKDIRRKTESMLELLQNIQSSTPRLGTIERHESTTYGGVPGPVDRRRLMTPEQCHRQVWEETSSSGECPEEEYDSLSPKSLKQEFHLPHLPVSPTSPRFNKGRRFSANDALAQSIERFHQQKSHLGRFPSTDAIAEDGGDAFESLGDLPKSRSFCASHSNVESSSNQSDEHPSNVRFKDQRGHLSAKQRSTSEDVSVNSEDDTLSPNDEIDVINSANKATSKSPQHPSLSRSLSVLAPDILPIIRAQTSSGRQPSKDDDFIDDNNNEYDDEKHAGDVSIVVPFHHKSERSLRLLARRQSLAAKPATFRNLGNRRNSSPDVLTSAPPITLNQRIILRSRQMSNFTTKSLPSSPRGSRSERLDLEQKIKNFLDRTDNFVKSGDGSPGHLGLSPET